MIAIRTDREFECPQLDAGLRARGRDLVTLPQGISEERLMAEAAGADLLLMCYTPITARVIEAASRLRGIVKYGVGIDAIDVEAARRRKIPVVNVPEYAEETVAEGAFAFMIALARKLVPLHCEMKVAGWAWPVRQWLSHDLAGKTLGLVGVGRIGRKLARMAAGGFRMPVLGFDPYVSGEAMERAGVKKCDRLSDLLSLADFVALHAVLNAETHYLIGRTEWGMMKATAMLINVSRGALVDEAALVDALLSGRVAGAGLDVFGDPHIQAQKCSRIDGTPYESVPDEVLIKDLTVAEIQSTFLCNKLFRGPTQQNDPALSPVSVAFFGGDASKIYVMPTLQQLFDFVNFYAAYYRTGAGSSHPAATKRWKNAERVRFNIETKVNPRTDTDPLHPGQIFAGRSIDFVPFAQAVANVIVANSLTERADIQSFDFRTLRVVQEQYPAIRTVYLFGDFPKFADPTLPGSDDGTNLQDQDGANTPWLAGLYWPYRSTRLTNPFRAQTSGGFEGMALSTDKTRLLPLLEKTLVGGEPGTLLIHEFNLVSKSYTGTRYKYLLNPRGEAIGDFVMFSASKGLVIERDNTQGDLNGFKTIFEIQLQGGGNPVKKTLAVNLMNINDPFGLSEPVEAGDIGLGFNFAFPFVTIEDVVVFDEKHIGVLNDNNFPFSLGRHAGAGLPDDNEFIVIQLDRPLGRK